MAINFQNSYPLITWDLNKKNLFFNYFGKKDDSARGFKVQILQDADVLIPSTESLRVYCVKKDNTKVYADFIISNSLFIVDLANSVFAVAGDVKCELQLSSNGKWVSSETFYIKVNDNLVDGSILSSDDYIALRDALDSIQTSIEQVTTAVADANTAVNTINATNQTVSDAEVIRVTAENTRINNEDIRIANENKRWDYFSLTQAEYNALPQADKDNPMYIYEITDNDGEFPTNLQTLINGVTTAKNNYDASVSSGSDLEVVEARTSGMTGTTSTTLKGRLDSFDEQLEEIENEKAEQSYVDAKFGSMGNSKIFKGSCTNVELLAKTGMSVDDYWYVLDLLTNKCYNGETWVDIGDNLSIGKSAIEPDNTNFINHGLNKFNPNKALKWYTIDVAGVVVANPTYQTIVSDKIYKNDYTHVIISYVTSGGTHQLQSFDVHQYRLNNTYIGKTTGSDVTFDSECYYFRVKFTDNFAAVLARLMIETVYTAQTTFSAFEAYKNILSEDIEIQSINTLQEEIDIINSKRTIHQIMSDLVFTSSTIKIKFLGDSITQGVGGTGFAENGAQIVSTWYRNPNGYCWANLLSAYLLDKFDCTVTNNGCRGMTTHDILYFWNSLVDGTEDICIVMIGTNNRARTEAEFYTELNTIKSNLEANGTVVIFMSATPVSVTNETNTTDNFTWHMEDVDNIISKFACANDMEYISLFKKCLDYLTYTGVSLNTLLVDGIHPNDTLYKLMYGWISEGLGLARKVDGATW